MATHPVGHDEDHAALFDLGGRLRNKLPVRVLVVEADASAVSQ